MEISMIINLSFLGLILFGFLTGFMKGTFKASFRLIYLVLLFVGLWLLMPTIYGVIESYLPPEFFEEISEYVSKEELADLAPFVLRAFLTPYVWLILAIVTLPIYWILCFIFKSIIVKKPARPELSEDKGVRKKQIKEYKKSLKPNSKSRLIGSLIGMVTTASIVFALCIPVTGAYETLKDDDGKVRCIKINDFDSCEYTSYYEESAVSKLFSVGGIGKKAFNAMSSGKAFGEKSSLGKDLANMVDVYFLLQENGVVIGEDIDYVKLLASLNHDEIQLLREYLTTSKLLMNIIDNIGLRILDKELELGPKYGIDVAKVSLSKELGIILDVASMLIELPFTKDDEMNKNYVEILNTLTDEDVDDVFNKLEESDIVDAVMAEYGSNELEKALVDALKEYNSELTLEFNDLDIVAELKIVVNAARDLAEKEVIYFNTEKGKVAIRSFETLNDYVTDEELDGLVEDLFESEILNQVVDGVASPLILDVLNDSLGKNYTAEELNLDEIVWKEELAHDLGLIIDLMDSGIMDTIESGDGNFFTAIADLETKDQLIDDMVNSKLLVGLLDAIAPEYVNEFATSLTDDPDYTFDMSTLDVKWEEELPALVDFVDMLNEGGMFEEGFDFIEYVGSLEETAGNDEIAMLSDAMTGSKIVMELIPTIAEGAISSIREDVSFDDVEWNDEIEPMLRVIKLFHSYGMFEDGEDVTNVVMDVIEVDENVDVIFASNVMYDIAITTIEEELAAIEVDGAPLLDVGPDGLGLTKDEWKTELDLLSSLLGDIDVVSEIANIGSLDPDVIINNNNLRSLGDMVDTLLLSKIFSQPIADKINETLELTGSDVKSVETLRTATWGNELIAANKILYEVDNAGEVTVNMVSDLVTTADSTVFVKDLVSTKVKDGLESVEVNGSAAFEQTFIDELDIYSVDWDVESDLLDDLNDLIDNAPVVVDSAYGAQLDAVLATGKNSTLLKPVIDRELKVIIKDNVTASYNGDVSFVDELDIFDMAKYNSSFAQEFSVLDSLEVISDDSYEFSVDDLNAFEEGGVIYNVANSVLATNVLDGSTVTLEVPDDLIKTVAIEKVNGMASCVTSLDLTNSSYGKDVIISLIVIE